MQILTINAGSTSVKLGVFGGDGSESTRVSEAHGSGGANANATEALGSVIGKLSRSGVLRGEAVSGVGHRFVASGSLCPEPTVIGDELVAELQGARAFAPFHMKQSIALLATARGLFPAATHVAVFDTAFHATMPPRAAGYAVPAEWVERHGVRRYGAHGLAHRWMSERLMQLASPAPPRRVVTLQLGGGCSACAVLDGHSVDTTMGLTPLEGLMMATRSGDVDPSLAAFVANREGVTVTDVLDALQHRSGLLGVSGESADASELVSLAAEGNAAADAALEMYCYRVRKAVGAYAAALGGLDALVFGGGVGEHVPAVRARVCDGLAWLGVRLDEAHNRAAVGEERCISDPQAPVSTWVLPVNEDALMARDVMNCSGRD